MPSSFYARTPYSLIKQSGIRAADCFRFVGIFLIPFRVGLTVTNDIRAFVSHPAITGVSGFHFDRDFHLGTHGVAPIAVFKTTGGESRG